MTVRVSGLTDLQLGWVFGPLFDETESPPRQPCLPFELRGTAAHVEPVFFSA